MPCEGTPSVSRSSIYDVTGLGNQVPCPNLVRSSGRSLMSIVGAFDVHRRQLTFEYLDAVTGELKRGRVAPADREHLREWLARLPGQDGAHFALEGCTGWPGTCPNAGSRRPTCWRRGAPSGCIRICSMSAAPGTSGSPPPCSTRGCR